MTAPTSAPSPPPASAPRPAPYANRVYFRDARAMQEVPDNTVHLIVTSPPYFNIKDYSLDGYQQHSNGKKSPGQIGDIAHYPRYIAEMLRVWKECERVLAPNGKLAINAPLMPMLKRTLNTHYNRHIYNINSDIEHAILQNTGLFLLDVYIWNRTNPGKRLMFGSYPYPRNFYAQNTTEFISVYVKDGPPPPPPPAAAKARSRLSQQEWIEYTKQIWNIPIPGKNDSAFGKHAAIMPEEIAIRCVKLYSFTDDIVLDPFAGSGTTLKAAKDLDRRYIGYELSRAYEDVIAQKLGRKLPC